MAANLVTAVAHAQQVLEQHTSPLQAARLEQRVPALDAEVLRRLRKAAGLSSTGFTDFLRTIDLSQCGAEPRTVQRVRLSGAVAEHVGDRLDDSSRALYDLMWQQMMPEAAQSPGLRRQDVVVALGATGEEDIFPAPPLFQPPERPLPTPDSRRLADAIGSGATFVVGHGAAGVGKTTTMLMLEAELPPSSVVVTYDCFGGGEYLSTGEARHTERRALVQLINELAVRCGTPLLARPPSDLDDLWRRLGRAVQAATAALDEGAALVIAVDAADNAIIAAGKENDRSFVPGLWRLPLPPRAHVVMTARTHRREGLQAPASAVEVILEGFDESSSLAHLRTTFPAATDADAIAFHANTAFGNPRTQFYVLDEASSLGLTLEQTLAESARTPEEVFSDLVDAALNFVSDAALSRERLATLMAMARPIRLSTYARVIGASVDEVRDFGSALVPGVVIDGETVAFRDEDFETFVSDQFSDDEERAASSRIADAFLRDEASDEDAARFLADHLRRSERFDELVRLALDAGEPQAITDAVARNEVYRRRLELALAVAGATRVTPDAIRLLLLAAEAVRSETALTAIVRSHPELSMRFGDSEAVARIYLRTGSETWRGPAHLRIAAMYARTGLDEQAYEQFSLAQAWLRRRAALDDSELNRWEIGAVDVARGAETMYWLRGLEEAFAYVSAWRPPEFRRESLWCFAQAIVASVEAETMQEQAALVSSTLLQGALLAAYWETNQEVPPEWVEDVSGSVLDTLRGEDPSPGAERWVVPFCEVAATSWVAAEAILEILDDFGPKVPQYAPHEWDSLSDYDLPLRSATLAAALAGSDLWANDLVPERLRPPEEEGSYDHNAGERRTFVDVVGRVVPAYVIRAKRIVRLAAGDEIAAEINGAVKDAKTRARHRWFKHDSQYRAWARVMTDVVRRHSASPTLVEAITGIGVELLRQGAPFLWLDVAEVLGAAPTYAKKARALIERASLFVVDQEWPASEKSDALLRCAVLAEAHDDELARSYYELAAEAAAGIDDEGARLLSVNATLAVRAAPPLDLPERRLLGERLISELERYAPLVSTPDVLPTMEVARAVANIDPPAALALISRWDDEGRVVISHSIGEVVHVLATANYLSPREALWLLRLAGEDGALGTYMHPLLDLVAGSYPRQDVDRMISEISGWITRDVPTSARGRLADEVVEWSVSRGFGVSAGIAELRSIAEFDAASKSDGDREGSEAFIIRADEDGDGEDAARRKMLETASRADIDALVDRIDEAARGWRHRGFVGTYLSHLADAIAPRERVALLDQLAELRAEGALVRLEMDSILQFLNESLQGWRTLKTISRWAPEGVARFARNQFLDLVAYDYQAESNLRRVVEMPLADRGTTMRALVTATGEHLNELSSRALHILAEFLAEDLNAEELGAVLDHSLPVRGVTPPDLPDAQSEALGVFVWGMLGHPDKAVRWRASHAARAIARAPNPHFVDALVSLWDRRDLGAFKASDVTFYWLSARQWLALVLARLADESPEVLRRHADPIAEAATDTDVPHAAVRELMKRAALRLVTAPDALAAPDENLLELSNAPSACLVNRKRTYGDNRRNPPNLRFHFDSMDTLPYWYSSPAQVFNRGCPARRGFS